MSSSETMFALKYSAVPIEQDADVMTIEDFDSRVNNGSFIDYDGFGYFASESMMSRIKIFPSDWKALPVPPAGATHVVWFNR